MSDVMRHQLMDMKPGESWLISAYGPAKAALRTKLHAILGDDLPKFVIKSLGTVGLMIERKVGEV